MSDTRNIDQLSAHEVKRLITRFGGLWTSYSLHQKIDKRARYWVTKPDFPIAVAKVGASKLYAGRSIQQWAEANGYVTAAERLKTQIDSMNRLGFEAHEWA